MSIVLSLSYIMTMGGKTMEGSYQSQYKNSWALVIGINEYKYVNPLGYARHDAEAIADILIAKFEFPTENVIKLIDGQATKEAILSSYLQFSKCHVDVDDRILVFFAGHGHTLSGNRKDVGCLIPVDGRMDDISTFIRWDELTRNADLIRAKHVFFIMDACFSGLAITRSLPQGSARYLNNMLQRYSRQVLTAGKANEVVADADGPIPEHSIFTGHLLQALSGGIESTSGIINANSVMSYVANKVSTDQYSNQSPHYGYFEGDGDFIFLVPVKDDAVQEDILMEVPLLPNKENDKSQNKLLDEVKGCLSDDRGRIELDTITTIELRRYIAGTGLPMDLYRATNGEVQKRLKLYDDISRELQTIAIATSHWGYPAHKPILKKIISRLADHIEAIGGNTASRWYPIYLLMYVITIAAIESERYDVVSEMLTMTVTDERYNNRTVVEATVRYMQELDQMNIFQAMLDGKNYHAPRSEYMFKTVQPILDDILFLGKSYEYLFDKADALIAMVYYDVTMDTGDSGWIPPGRFAWKYIHGYSGNAVSDIIREATFKKEEWAPLKGGLFSGSFDRFQKITVGVEAFLKKLNWW